MPEIKNIAIFGQLVPFDMVQVASFGYFVGPAPETIPDHVNSSMKLFVEQFEDSENFKSLASAFIRPYNEIEIQLAELNKIKDLNNATGDRLDILGEIVGEERKSRPDDEYRTAIRVKIFLNSSSGEAARIIQAAISFTQATRIDFIEDYPAGILLEITTPFPLPANLIDELEKIALAGVRIGISLSNDGDDFIFDDEGGFFSGPGLGFGETGAGFENEGGKFVELII
jgi:phosphomannomutase